MSYIRYGDKEFISAFIRDLSDRIAKEKSLHENEYKYRMIVENADAVIMFLSLDGVSLSANRAAGRLFGGKPQEFVGKSLHDLWSPEAADALIGYIRQLRNTGNAISINEFPAIINGRRYWFKVNLQPIKDTDGNISCIQVLADDITSLKSAQENIIQFEQMYRAILASSPHGQCMINPGWNIVWANDAMKGIFDPKGTLLSLEKESFKQFFEGEEEFETYRKSSRAAILKKGCDRRDVTLVTLDGDAIKCNLSLVRMDPSQTAPGYVATITVQ